MEFSSYEHMMKFEKEREDYYLDFIRLCDTHDPFKIAFYKRLFRDTFHPKYRAIKKMYDNYSGGFWRDENGYLCAENVAFIDKKYIDDGEICIEWKNECVYAVYLKRDGVLYKFTPEQFR